MSIEKEKEKVKVEWSRKQKRCYQRINTFADYFRGRDYQLLRMDLTSSEESDYGKIGEHFNTLLKRIKRKYPYEVEVFRVKTKEGFGVIHAILAVRFRDGRKEGVWIDQGWLSENWQDIHKAKVVFVKRIRGKDKDQKRVACYLVNQYISGQSFDNYSWSRKNIFPISKVWASFKELIRDFMAYKSWVFGSDLLVELGRDLMVSVWKNIVVKGYCFVGRGVFFLSDGSVDVVINK